MISFNMILISFKNCDVKSSKKNKVPSPSECLGGNSKGENGQIFVPYSSG